LDTSSYSITGTGQRLFSSVSEYGFYRQGISVLSSYLFSLYYCFLLVLG